MISQPQRYYPFVLNNPLLWCVVGGELSSALGDVWQFPWPPSTRIVSCVSAHGQRGGGWIQMTGGVGGVGAHLRLRMARRHTGIQMR